MTFPVAMIPYANMAPFRALGEPQGCSFIPVVPRLSVSALNENRVLAAAVPVGGLPFLGDSVEYLGCYGIGSRGPCMSVILFSDLPLQEMDGNVRIRLTGESASSVRLLRLLLGNLQGFDNLPHMVLGQESSDCLDCQGELIIGDVALAEYLLRSHGQGAEHEERFPLVTDLAEEWFRQTGLPFVFARWVIRRDAPQAARESLLAWLEEFRAREAEMVTRSAPQAAREMGVSEEDMLKYFSVIRRSLGPEDQEGQDLFNSEYQRHARDIEIEVLSPI